MAANYNSELQLLRLADAEAELQKADTELTDAKTALADARAELVKAREELADAGASGNDIQTIWVSMLQCVQEQVRHAQKRVLRAQERVASWSVRAQELQDKLVAATSLSGRDIVTQALRRRIVRGHTACYVD